LQAGVAEARFLIAGGIDPPSSVLATLDVNDVTENHRLRASLDVTGTMLPASAYKEFSLPFLIPPDNHSLEFRIWWKGAGMIRADKVTIVAK
jgi:hypothetical protein